MPKKMNVEKVVIITPYVLPGLHGGIARFSSKRPGDIMELAEADADQLIGSGRAEEYRGPLAAGENIWVSKRGKRDEVISTTRFSSTESELRPVQERFGDGHISRNSKAPIGCQEDPLEPS
jgi:hypothetical protein